MNKSTANQGDRFWPDGSRIEWLEDVIWLNPPKGQTCVMGRVYGCSANGEWIRVLLWNGRQVDILAKELKRSKGGKG